MGSGCSNLSLLSNPCDISRCATSLQLLPQTTASPSAQCIITLQPGTHFDGKGVEKVFVKFFVNPFDVSTSFFVTRFNQIFTGDAFQLDKSLKLLKLNLDFLYYEMVLQGSVITPIVTQNICPFFPMSYSNGYNCGYSDLMALMKTPVERIQLPTFIINTFLQYMLDKRLDKGKITELLTNIRYCMSVSEVIPGIDIGQWMVSQGVLTNKKHLVDFWVIMFQVALACYVMELAGVSHNDLHKGNVMIITHASPVQYCFFVPQLNPPYIRFQSKYQVKVFDFDRSNFSSFENKAVRSYSSYSYTTAPVKGKDLLNLFLNLGYFLRKSSDTTNVLTTFRRQLTADKLFENLLMQMANTSPYLQLNNKALSKTWFKNMNSSTFILSNFIRLGRLSQTGQEPTDVEVVHVIDPQFFENSRVITTKVYHTLQQLQVQHAGAEYSPEHVQEETRSLEADIKSEERHIRLLELELEQQKYDLNQLQHQVDPVLLQVVQQLQKVGK